MGLEILWKRIKGLNAVNNFGKRIKIAMLKIHQQNAGRLNLANQDTILLGKHTRV